MFTLMKREGTGLLIVLLILSSGCTRGQSDDGITEQYIGPTECKLFTGPQFGSVSYTGPLIDTHYHIPHFDGTADSITPVLGDNIKISNIVCSLEQEDTNKVFAFFPVFHESDQAKYLQIARRTMELYPDTFVPFIMPPDRDNDIDGYPTVSADVLEEMLNVYPGLFTGYGEIGLYAREPGGAAELPPDSERLQDIYPVVRENKLLVYFHLGEGHKDNFESILEQNPDINFIWHGDQLSIEEVEDVISNHPNAYYTIDELYGDVWMINPNKTKEEFLSHLQNYEALLEIDINTWKAVIERRPDQFMWGTDRSPAVLWSHDPEVGQALANYGRAFIARLATEVQEKFAYKNAERLLTR